MHAFKKARRGGVKGKKELQAGAKLKRGKKRVLSAEAERAPDHVVLEVGDRTGVPREDNLHCPVGCISCILATAAVLGLLWNLRSFVDTIDDNLGGAFQAGVCTVNGFEGPRPKEPSLAQSNLMSPPPPPAGMPLYFPKCYFKDATTADDTVACKNGEAKDAPKFFATAANVEGKGQGYIPSGRWCPGVGLCRHLNVTFEGADGNQSVATSAQWTSTMARDLGAERASAVDGEVTFTGRRWSQADYPTWSAGAFPEWFGAANGSAAGEGSAVSEAQLAAAFREYVYDPRGLELRLPLDRESLDHRASTDSPYPYVGEWCAAPPHRPPARPPPRSPPHRARPPPRAQHRARVLGGPQDGEGGDRRARVGVRRGGADAVLPLREGAGRCVREQPAAAAGRGGGGGGGEQARRVLAALIRRVGVLLPRRRRDAALLRLLLLPLLSRVVVPQQVEKDPDAAAFLTNVECVPWRVANQTLSTLHSGTGSRLRGSRRRGVLFGDATPRRSESQSSAFSLPGLQEGQ